MENNTEYQEPPHIQALRDVLTALDIPFCSLFWNENVQGRKPKNYAIYYETNIDDSLSSNNDTESEHTAITVSFYLKSKDFRKIKRSAYKAFIAAGFCVSVGYETFENDTGYQHIDLNLDYYTEV